MSQRKRRVRILGNVTIDMHQSYLAGENALIDASMAEALIKHGLAEKISRRKKDNGDDGQGQDDGQGDDGQGDDGQGDNEAASED